MERDRIKSSSSLKVKLNKNLPTLRSSTLATKSIISLSKVDIDCRPPSKDRLRASSVVEVEPQRTKTSFNLRKNKELLELKMMSRGGGEGWTGSPIKNAMNAIRQAREEEQAGAVSISIEKSKVSSKSYGIVKAYSANSHPGPVLSNNEDRICIITNLTKTNVKQRQISFFGVYDGCRGVAKADYLRDNFHVCLAEEQSFPRDMEYAMRRTLKKLSTAFSSDPKYVTDESSVSFAVVVIFNEEIHYIQSGSCRGVFSTGMGQSIFVPQTKESIMALKEGLGRKSKSVGELARRVKGWKELSEIDYKCFKEEEGVDFVMLGSEGLFQNMKIRELGRRCWLYLLRNKNDAIHVTVGEANNYLMTDVFSALGSKNTSLIIVAFGGVASCLEGPELKQELILPYFPGWSVSQ